PAGETKNGASDDEWLDLAKPVADANGAPDTDYDNSFEDTGAPSIAPGGADSGWASVRQRSGSFGDDEINPESFVSNEPSLRDHLTAQLPLVIHDHTHQLIGYHLIDMVDEAGYLHADLHQLALKLGAPYEMVEDVLTTLQTFDPVGVF